jgi:hypothetical protein
MRKKIQTNRFNYSQSQQNPLQYPQEFLQLQDLTSPMDQPIQEAEANKKMDLNIDSTKRKRKISYSRCAIRLSELGFRKGMY